MIEKKKVVNKVVNFFNWTDEDFIHTFGGDPQEYPAMEATPIYIGDFKTNEGVRDLMAYHLAIRELNKENYIPASKQDQKLLSYIAKAKVAPTLETIPEPKGSGLKLPDRKEEDEFEQA